MPVLAFVVALLGKKAAVITMFVSLMAVFYLTMVTIVVAATAGVSATVPGYVTQTLSWFLPSDTGLAMAAVMSARVARWVYESSLRVITIAAQVS